MKDKTQRCWVFFISFLFPRVQEGVICLIIRRAQRKEQRSQSAVKVDFPREIQCMFKRNKKFMLLN